MTLYDTLGVSKDATDQEIDEAYRHKAKKAHPDAGGSNEAFNTLRKAALVLRDPGRRKKYDDTGEVDDATRLDDPDMLAWELITGAIWQCVEDESYTLHGDLVEGVNIWLTNNLKQIENNLAKFKRNKDKLEKIIKRLKRRKKAKNSGKLHDFLAQGLMGQNNTKIIEASKVRDRFRRAIELLADYEFDPEQMQNVTYSASSSGLGNIFGFGR